MVLLTGIMISLIVTRQYRELSRAQDQQRFMNHVVQTSDAINSRLDTYVAMLRGTAGFVGSTNSLSKSTFEQFVRRLRSDEFYPGIQGVGYTIRYNPDELDALTDRLRQEGHTNFKVWSNHPQQPDEHHAIIYLEPLDRRNQRAIGYDMYSEPVRRKAMQRSRDTGMASSSGKVQLVQEIDNQIQAGFLIYVPVYRDGVVPSTLEERREKLLGFAYSPFRADDLLAGIVGEASTTGIIFKIYDSNSKNPANVLHRSVADFDVLYERAEFEQEVQIDNHGRLWSIVFATSPEFELASGKGLWIWVLTAGIIFTILLTAYIHQLIVARRIAETSAFELQQSEEALRILNETLEHRVYERTAEVEHYANQLRLMSSELSLAEQRERRRLAAELHDYLAQLLVVCKMKTAQLYKHLVENSPISIVKNLDQLIDESLRYTRNLIAQLSPSILYESGFIPAIHWLASQIQSQYQLEVRINTDLKQVQMRDDKKVLLFQVIREILLNVVKHAGVKEAFVDIFQKDNIFTIIVQDHGKGFNPVILREQKDKFGKYGLFSVQERLETLGGDLYIDSAVGQGTRVTIQLLLEAGHYTLPVELEEPAYVQPSCHHTDGSFQVRVLIADDHDMVREGLCHIIETYKELKVVGKAANGEEAVHLVRELHPDAVVMDLNMPVLNGIEATRRIKNDFPAITVIGLSVHRDQDMANAMKDAGADSYFIKGNSSDELCRMLINSKIKVESR